MGSVRGYLRQPPGVLFKLQTIELIARRDKHSTGLLSLVDPYDLKRSTSILIPFRRFFLEKRPLSTRVRISAAQLPIYGFPHCKGRADGSIGR